MMKLLSAIIPVCFVFVETLPAQVETSKLAGSWHLSLWVTEPAAESAGPRTGGGRLELRRLNMEQPTLDRSEIYSVTYDTTLHVMLGAPHAGPAQAALNDGGAVHLIFNPFVDHGAFRLRGVLRGDSINGEWYRSNFADDRYRGAFRMVRRPEPGRGR